MHTGNPFQYDNPVALPAGGESHVGDHRGSDIVISYFLKPVIMILPAGEIKGLLHRLPVQQPLDSLLFCNRLDLTEHSLGKCFYRYAAACRF